MRFKSPVGLHPFLLAAAPAVFLYARSFNLFAFEPLVYTLLAITAAVFAAAAALSLVIRSRPRRTLILSCVIVFVFAYTNFVTFMISRLSVDWPQGSLAFLVLWALPLTVCIYAIGRLDKSLPYLNKILNVFAVCLICLSLLKAAANFPAQYKLLTADYELPGLEASAARPRTGQPLPNIFLIVLDRHMGQSGLDRYGYDSSAFMEALDARGFYTARQSHSNYWMTNASTASFLNYDYLDFQPKLHRPMEINYYLAHLKNHNRLFAFCKRLGYTTAQCRTDFIFRCDEVHTADMQLAPDPWYRSPVPQEVFGNTPFYMLLSRLADKNPDRTRRDLNTYWLRRNIYDAIEQTRQMTHFEKPFVLFTHILCPHGPETFNENGGYPNEPSPFQHLEVRGCDAGAENELRRYLAQVAFIDKQMIGLVDYILEHSKEPPIIILMGDHGRCLRVHDSESFKAAAPEMYSILNAVYLPDRAYEGVLYPSISPVNVFRSILNHCFGTDYERLPDRSFYSSDELDWQLRDGTAYLGVAAEDRPAGE